MTVDQATTYIQSNQPAVDISRQVTQYDREQFEREVANMIENLAYERGFSPGHLRQAAEIVAKLVAHSPALVKRAPVGSLCFLVES